MIQLFKIIAHIAILSFCFSKSLISIGEVVETVGKTEYYKLDKNGVLFEELSSDFEYGDSIRIKLFFRHAVKSDFKGEKEFRVAVALNNEEAYALAYEKEISTKQKNNKKGWGWTKAGIWFIDIDVKDFNKLLVIRDESKNKKIIVRAQVSKLSRNSRYKYTFNSFDPVNRVLRTKIATKKDSKPDTPIISYYYKLSDSKKTKHFEIIGPTSFQLLTRLEAPNEDQTQNDYSVFIKKDGIDIGTYFFNTEISQESKVASSQMPVGKWRSCFINVPKGRHYYSISKGHISDKAIYIKLKEYEAKK